MRWTVFVLFSLIWAVKAWDDGDLEVFDVVEEVNQNFYELLGVGQVRIGIKFRKKLNFYSMLNIQLL